MYIHYMYPLVVIYVKEVFVYCILIINIYLFTFITDKLKPQLHTHLSGLCVELSSEGVNRTWRQLGRTPQLI